MTDPIEQPTAPGEADPAPAMGREVGRGATWLMLGTAISKSAAMVAQVVLGWLLTDVHFGVFATASGIGWFIGILKDAGTNAILMQRGPKDYEKIVGPLFWMNMTFSGLCAALIAAIAYPIGNYKNEHVVTWILLVIALSTPLQTLGGVLLTKIRQDLRFAEYSRIQVISATLRQITTVVFAIIGFGAMSFAWPYVVCAVYEAAAAYLATREKVWTRRPEVHLWRGFFKQGLWTIAGAGANFALDQGPYLVLGLLVVPAVTGQFFFAFQLTAQIGVLMGLTVQLVLIPVLVRLNSEPIRQAAAAVRCLHALSLTGSFVCVLLSTCIEPLEAIVWRGRWASAVPAIIALGVFYVWRINFGLTTAVLHAQGRFKRHALLTACEGVGLMISCAVVAFLTPDSVTNFAFVSGAWLFVGRLLVTIIVMRTIGVPVARTIEATIPSWLITIIAGGCVLWLDRHFHWLAHTRQVSEWVLGSLGLGQHAAWIEALAQGLRALAMGSLALAISLVGVRLIIAEHLRDAVEMTPVRFRPLARRLLHLNAPPPAQTNPA